MCFLQHSFYFTQVWLIIWFFAGTLIWYQSGTCPQRHTVGPTVWHNHINMHQHHLPSAHSSYLYYTEFFTDVKNLLSTMSFLYKNYSRVEVIYQLIICNKTKLFLWNANNTDKNGVNKQNIYTTNTQRKNLGRDEGVCGSNCESDCVYLFFFFLIVKKKEAMTSPIFELDTYHYTETSIFLRKYYMLTRFKSRRLHWMYLTFCVLKVVLGRTWEKNSAVL